MEYNPFSPEVKENPYPYYAYLRNNAPVYHIESLDWWAVTRHENVLSVLKNPDPFSSAASMSAALGEFNFAHEVELAGRTDDSCRSEANGDVRLGQP